VLTFPTTPVFGTAQSYDRVVNDWPMVLLKVLRIDVESEPGLSARFSVTGTPTFLLYKKGHLMGRIDGAPKTHSALRDWVLQALGA
jgi:hypothetical protein